MLRSYWAPKRFEFLREESLGHRFGKMLLFLFLEEGSGSLFSRMCESTSSSTTTLRHEGIRGTESMFLQLNSCEGRATRHPPRRKTSTLPIEIAAYSIRARVTVA
jgi:hypothetical protein